MIEHKMNPQDILTKHSELNPEQVIVLSLKTDPHTSKSTIEIDISPHCTPTDALLLERVLNLHITRFIASQGVK